MRRGWLWALGACGLLSVLVRLPPLASNLSLDEIWTLNLLELVRNPADILVALRHDNNHWLNTLYLYLVGAWRWEPGYRLLSFAAGIGTVILTAQIGKKYGRAVGLTAALACAVSYLVVDLTTQARGFAPAMFFGVAAWLLLDRFLKGSSGRGMARFQATVGLGFLSHLTFLLAYAGLFAWSAVALARRKNGWRTLAELHAPIGAGLVALYWLAVRGMIAGGGVHTRPLEALGDLAHYTLGTPASWWWVFFAAAAVAGWECRQMLREGNEEWAFFAGAAAAALVAIPAWNLAHFTPRQLAVLIPMLLVALSRFVCRLRWAGALLIAAFLVAQGFSLASFYRDGRGGYADAAQYLRSQGGAVAADPNQPEGDFRVRMVLWYYGADIPLVGRSGWRSTMPDWVIVCDPKEAPSRPLPSIERGGIRFRYERIFRSGGTTPLHWVLYRRG